MELEERRDLVRIARNFEGRRILVVGDLILDRFVWGRVDRISPEAPVPVVEVTGESIHLGGAANVACNLAALGARPQLAGLVGTDREGLMLTEELRRIGIEEKALIRDQERRTTVKTRIIASHQQVCRTDREDRRPVDGSQLDQLLASCGDAFDSVEAVVFSDYAKGVLTERTIPELASMARSRSLFAAVDPKSDDYAVYRGVSMITPNKKEAEAAAGMRIFDESSLVTAGRKLIDKSDLEHLLITRGEEGMTLLDRSSSWHIPTAAREVFDVTGAGDTVIAVMALGVASGATPLQAAALANHAAGVVVGKLGTSQAELGELLDSLGAG